MKILILLVFLIVSNTNGREIYLLENVKHRERGLGSKFFQPIDRQDAVDPALADLITGCLGDILGCIINPIADNPADPLILAAIGASTFAGGIVVTAKKNDDDKEKEKKDKKDKEKIEDDYKYKKDTDYAESKTLDDLDKYIKTKKDEFDKLIKDKAEGLDKLIKGKKEGLDKLIGGKKDGLNKLIKLKKDKLFFPLLPIKAKIDKIKDALKDKTDEDKGGKDEPVDIQINTNGADDGGGGGGGGGGNGVSLVLSSGSISGTNIILVNGKDDGGAASRSALLPDHLQSRISEVLSVEPYRPPEVRVANVESDVEPEVDKLVNFSLNIENNFEQNDEGKLGSILAQQASNEASKEMLKAEFSEFLYDYDYEADRESGGGTSASEKDLKKAAKLLVENQHPNEVDSVMDLKERLKCGYQESDGGGCDRDPWHGLLYVTDKETQGAEFISSVALVHLADQNPIIIAGGTILSKARQDLEQVGYEAEIRFCNERNSDIRVPVKRIVQHPEISTCVSDKCSPGTFTANDISVISVDWVDDTKDLVPVCLPDQGETHLNHFASIVSVDWRESGTNLSDSTTSSASHSIINEDLFTSSNEAKRRMQISETEGKVVPCISSCDLCSQQLTSTCTESNNSIQGRADLVTVRNSAGQHVLVTIPSQYEMRNDTTRFIGSRISSYLSWLAEDRHSQQQ